MGKTYFKTAPLERVTDVKTILYIWTTRIIPSKGPCKVSNQFIVFLQEIVEYKSRSTNRQFD